MDYRKEILEIMRNEGLSKKDLSDLTGIDYGYLRNVLMPSEFKVVNWMKAFVMGYKLGSGIRKK